MNQARKNSKPDATYVERRLQSRDAYAWYYPLQARLAEILGDDFKRRRVGGVSLAHVQDLRETSTQALRHLSNGLVRREIHNHLPPLHNEPAIVSVKWPTTLRSPSKLFIALSLESEQVTNEKVAVHNALGNLGLRHFNELSTLPHLTLGSIELQSSVDSAVFRTINEIVPQEFPLSPVRIADRTRGTVASSPTELSA